LKHSHLAERALGDLMTALASNDVSPGAGAAGAVALALAAACAGKAVAITLKHRQEDESLTRVGQQLAEIRRRAMFGADEDSRRFEDFIHEKDARSAVALIRAGEGLQHLAEVLREVLRDIETQIDSVMAGDIAAAHALCDAFAAIQAANLEETRRAADLRE